MRSFSRLVLASLLSAAVGFPTVCSAQHKFTSKDGQGLLSQLDISKLADTLEELLADGELRQVIATVAGLKSKLAVPKLDPRYRLCQKIEILALRASYAKIQWPDKIPALEAWLRTATRRVSQRPTGQAKGKRRPPRPSGGVPAFRCKFPPKDGQRFLSEEGVHHVVHVAGI